MAVPKNLHYCWFGENELPGLEKRCIESWHKVLPEYNMMLWNEKTFDVTSIPYVKQAYEKKKYAFVSDYVRIHALYTYGGIYLDTDVEIIRPFDKFLNNDTFLGFENKTSVGTGIIGSSEKSILMTNMLKYYHDHNFADKNDNVDVTTNVQILMDILYKLGLVKQNSEQHLDGIHIYERDVFCPKKLGNGKFSITDRTVALHYFSGSWLTERERKRGNNALWRKVFRPVLKILRNNLIKITGEKKAKSIEIFIRNKIK